MVAAVIEIPFSPLLPILSPCRTGSMLLVLLNRLLFLTRPRVASVHVLYRCPLPL